jgi:hypothetical protein
MSGIILKLNLDGVLMDAVPFIMIICQVYRFKYIMETKEEVQPSSKSLPRWVRSTYDPFLKAAVESDMQGVMSNGVTLVEAAARGRTMAADIYHVLNAQG